MIKPGEHWVNWVKMGPNFFWLGSIFPSFLDVSTEFLILKNLLKPKNRLLHFPTRRKRAHMNWMASFFVSLSISSNHIDPWNSCIILLWIRRPSYRESNNRECRSKGKKKAPDGGKDWRLLNILARRGSLQSFHLGWEKKELSSGSVPICPGNGQKV